MDRRGTKHAAGDETLHGLRAGLAVFARRPEAIRRIAYDAAKEAELAALLDWAYQAGVRADPRSDDELTAIAGGPQHEGLCIRTTPRPWVSPSELPELLLPRQGVALALDRVRNPYNIGAVLRSAGFFGLDAVLLGAPAPHPGLSAQAVRVAEGGVEHVAMSRTTDLADTLARLRARGIAVVGADGTAPHRALGYAYPRPLVLVMGNEREGLAPRVRAQCDALVAIAGSGAVESLNVGVAAGILLAEVTRDRGVNPSRSSSPRTPRGGGRWGRTS